MTFLTGAEAQALLEPSPPAPGPAAARPSDVHPRDPNRAAAQRDHQPADRQLHLGAAPHVACTGKGRKNRTTPLTSATPTALESYLHERVARPGQALFPAPTERALGRRRPTTPGPAPDPGHASCPELAGKHVTVHTLRHTAAMRFLEAGIDTAVIALWLGHETIATTSIYLHADMNLKRAALDRTRQPDTPPATTSPTTL